MASKDTQMAVISVVLAMLSIQTGAALAKDLFPLVGSVGTTALRLVFAAIILCVVFRPWRDMPRGKGWVPVCLYGAALGGMNILFYMAIERIPLGVAIALEFTGPLAVALWAARSLRDMVWVACAVAGIFLLLPVTEFSAALDPLGVALALGAGVGWALYIVFGQRSGEDAHGGRVVALGMCVAALLYAPIGVWTAGVTLLNGHVLAFGLMIAVLSSALPYSLEMVAIKKLSRQAFSILMSLEPAIGTLSGWVWLGEKLAPVQCIAIALVVVASVGSTLTAKKATHS